MGNVWSLEFSIFAMMAVGLLIRKIRLADEKAEAFLTNLVMMVILPCNIVASFFGEYENFGASDCLAVTLLSAGIQIVAVIYAKLAFPKEHPDRRVNLGYAMICSNAGFLGNPVAEGIYGPVGLLLASFYLMPQRIMMWTEGIAVYSGEKNLKATVRKVVTHPCMIACAVGIVIMITGVRLPEAVLSPIEAFGRCCTPLSMMVIGMILADIDPKHLVDKTIVRFTIHRLILMPLLVFLACRLLPVSDTVTGVSVLLAAMPAGATTSMMASQYGRDPAFASRLVVFTTLCSIPAIMLWNVALRMV